jgi:hypothetical protein
VPTGHVGQGNDTIVLRSTGPNAENVSVLCVAKHYQPGCSCAYLACLLATVVGTILPLCEEQGRESACQHVRQETSS